MDRDLHPDRRRAYLELLRARSPAERLLQAGELTDAARHMAELGIRRRHPGASDREVLARLAALLYGRAIAERIYGSFPGEHG